MQYRNFILVIALMSFLTLVSSGVIAQDFHSNQLTITQGEPITTKKNAMSYMLVGDNNVYSINYMKRKPYIVKYDEDLQIENTVQLEPNIIPKRAYVERSFCFNGSIVLFYSEMDKAAKSNKLFYTILSQSDLSTLEEATEIMELKYTTKRNSGNFDVSMSRDSSKLLVFANTPTSRARNAKDEVAVVVINQEFKVLWKDKIEIPYVDKDFAIRDYDVDNDGNIYLLGLHYKDRSEREKKTPISTNKILAFYDEGSEMKEVDLELSNKYISQVSYLIRDDGNLLCTGFYSDNSSLAAAGAFYLEIEAETFDVLVETMEEFELDFFTDGLSERATKRVEKRAKKGKDAEFIEFKVRNLIEKADGGLIMVAEQHYIQVVTTTTSSPNGGTTTTTTVNYYYNDIIVVSFDQDGAIEWHQKINKYQFSSNDNGYKSGFEMALKDDVMHFYFVDEGKDVLELDINRTSRDQLKALYFIHATIDLDGERDVESLGEIERRSLRPIPKEFVTLRNGTTIMFSLGKREYQLGIIKPN